MGPHSLMNRLTIPRAGRPTEEVRQCGVPRRVAAQCRAVDVVDRRLRARQIRRADLHASGTERTHGPYSGGLGNPAGGDDRHRQRVGELRYQRKRANLRRQIAREEHSAMPARLQALGNDRIDAVRLQPQTFVDRRCGCEDDRPPRPYTIKQREIGQTEVKADDRRAILLDDVGNVGVEREAPARGRRHRSDRSRTRRSTERAARASEPVRQGPGLAGDARRS